MNSISKTTAQILLPLPLPGYFTYLIDSTMLEKVIIGGRVVVQFGKSRILTGIVVSINNNDSNTYRTSLKTILDCLDDFAVIHPQQIRFYEWIADYYMCTVGEVMNVAIPSGLKLSSESYIQLNPNYATGDYTALNDKEFSLVQTLEQVGQLSYQETCELLALKNIYHIIKSLTNKGAVIIFEKLKEKYKPKTVKKIRLNSLYIEVESELEAIFQKLEKTTKQHEVLLSYINNVPVFDAPESNIKGILKSELLNKGVSPSSLKTLIKNNVFEEFEERVSRLSEISSATVALSPLSIEQQKAVEAIQVGLENKGIALLHGITGSGKTEVYAHVLTKFLQKGKQVLYLLPEIALTVQIIQRLKSFFGSKIGIYHSKYSDNERVEIWNGVLSGKHQLVVGVRSAIFLPFNNLSLIVVDEEHENSFKQFDPAPRYHARDLSVVLTKLYDCKCLLGSATPSLESVFNVKAEKYSYTRLEKRYSKVPLPSIELVDLKKEKKRKTMKGEFSSIMMEAIEKALANKEQIILFQNRRGYSPFLTCDDCGETIKCQNCDVSLTYHLHRQILKCHYCGYKETLPGSCLSCGSTKLESQGFGTEKLEEDLKLFFPTARVQRMDYDTTRNKYSYDTIINEFTHGDIDILVGTQMVSKGLDFGKVSLVGVFDTDRMIHYPDFRSHERTFQLITQVSGRAGRRDKQGHVIIQTFNPDEEVLQSIVRNDDFGLWKHEMFERQKFHYPPYTKFIKAIIKDYDIGSCAMAARAYVEALIPELGQFRVLGPKEPAISKIRNMFYHEVYVRIERNNVSLGKVKEVMKIKALELQKTKKFKRTAIIFDVDPY